MHPPPPPPPPALTELKIKASHSKVTICGKKAVAPVTLGHQPAQFLITRQLNREWCFFLGCVNARVDVTDGCLTRQLCEAVQSS